MSQALNWYFQEESIDSIINYFHEKTGNPIAVLPTATGKGRIIGKLVKKILSLYPNTQFVIATFSKELVMQNYLEFIALCPEVSAGIYSAGLNKRDMHHQVLFCGIQSVYKKALNFGRRELLIVDEVQAVPKSGDGMWLTFIENLKISNPYMKVIGLSATPYRMDTGLLTDGDDRVFTDICYEYPLIKAIQEGYVSELIPKRMNTKYDISQVHKRGGEYIPGELQKAMNIDEKTVSAVNEIIELGSDRKSWLVFAAGNEHAKALYEEIGSRGISCALVLQDTPRAERDKAVNDIKNFKIKCLINNMIFTTGFNVRNIDLIACFRATHSAGLWTQICGRGFRLYPEKENCLMLDYSNNALRHGPLDQITGKKNKKKGEGEAPIKNCPKCHAVMYAGAMECPDCGYLFPENPPEITKTASDAPILSTQIKPTEPITHIVFNTTYSRHLGKDGKPDSFRAKYSTYTGDYSEFVFFEHLGRAREKACFWHRKLLPNTPAPNSIEAALKMPYPQASEVEVRKNGKFWEVVSVKYKEDGLAEILPPIEPLDSGVMCVLEDDILF